MIEMIRSFYREPKRFHNPHEPHQQRYSETAEQCAIILLASEQAPGEDRKKKKKIGEREIVEFGARKDRFVGALREPARRLSFCCLLAMGQKNRGGIRNKNIPEKHKYEHVRIDKRDTGSF